MSKEKILIIEDTADIREIVTDMLSLEGYDVIGAEDGSSGILAALDRKPDLIICDIMMPKMDGYEVLLNLKEVNFLSNTPFIFLTAKNSKEDFREAMNLGADDFISKPFNSRELIQAVETRLDKSKRLKLELNTKLKELKTTVNSTSPHEFNTPLTGIVGSSELLMRFGDEFSKTELKQLYQSIYLSGVRLKNIIDNNILINILLHIESNPETKSFYSQGKTASVKSVVNRSIKWIDEAYDYRNQFVLRLDEDSPAAISELNLEKILKEILENAIKFSDRNSQIEVKGERKLDEFHLTITDQGIGMSKEEINEIGPYIQFNREQLEQQGMGLGLYISKKLIQLNGGDLTIQSTVNHGTKIVLAFKIQRFEN
jgi:two-component system, sensor histidine kinase and response regulator